MFDAHSNFCKYCLPKTPIRFSFTNLASRHFFPDLLSFVINHCSKFGSEYSVNRLKTWESLEGLIVKYFAFLLLTAIE